MFGISAKFRRCTAFAVMSSVLLAGCGSKPEAGDIAKQVTAAFQCRALSIADVKKVNGADEQDGTYEVLYTFKAEIKGGKAAAAELLGKWAAINERVAYLEKNRWTIGPHEAMQQAAPLKQQAADLLGCDSLEAFSWMEHLMLTGKESLAQSTGPIRVPVALELQGAGVMKKSEAGWVFVQALPHKLLSVVQSDPVNVERPVAVAARAAAPVVAGPVERTLVGIVKSGTADSCFSVGSGTDEKCYAIPAEGPSTAQIFGSCKAGAKCSITATFDDVKDELGAVKAVSTEY